MKKKEKKKLMYIDPSHIRVCTKISELQLVKLGMTAD